MKSKILTLILTLICVFSYIDAQLVKNDFTAGLAVGDNIEKGVYSSDGTTAVMLNQWSLFDANLAVADAAPGVSPKVVSPLAYTGYIESEKSNAIGLNPTPSGIRMSQYSLDEATGTIYSAANGPYYLAFMLNVDASTTVTTINGSTVLGFNGGANSNWLRGLFTITKVNATDFKIGIATTLGGTSTFHTAWYETGKTHLIVLKIDLIGKSIKMFANPTDFTTSTEPAATKTVPLASVTPAIRSISVFEYSDFKAIVGGIRFGKSWESVVKNDYTVQSGAALSISEDATINNLDVQSGGTLNIAADKTLTINAGKHITIDGTVNNNITGKIKLLSNSADGTATLTGNFEGPAEVQQYLASQRNWYMSSPVSAALRPNSTDYANVESYNETGDTWSELAIDGTMVIGKGYVVYPATTGEKTITFTGTLNSGNKSIGLTSSTVNTTYKGFNLVGNPYPSFLNAAAFLNESTNAANVLPTIWYRTKDATGYNFQTYNATSGVTVPDMPMAYIPPMQSFWVRAKADGVNLNYNDGMRMHNNKTGSVIPLKVPAKATNQILRLQLSNGNTTDEAVVYFNANAQNTYDFYDSPKMMNNGTTVPNIFTTVGSENLVINGMNNIPYDVAIPLSIQGTAGNYTVTKSEFSNFSSTDKVILVDNGIQNDLSLGNYTFTLSAGEPAGRFSLLFPSNVPTAINNTDTGKSLVFVRNNRIMVDSDELGGKIAVYNQIGQILVSQPIIDKVTELNRPLPAGIYFIKVNNHTSKVLIK